MNRSSDDKDTIRPMEIAGLIMVLFPAYLFLTKDAPSNPQLVFRVAVFLIGTVLLSVSAVRRMGSR